MTIVYDTQMIIFRWGSKPTSNWHHPVVNYGTYVYPLVMTNIAIEHGQFLGDLPLQNGVFRQQTVNLPEGTNQGYSGIQGIQAMVFWVTD